MPRAARNKPVPDQPDFFTTRALGAGEGLSLRGITEAEAPLALGVERVDACVRRSEREGHEEDVAVRRFTSQRRNHSKYGLAYVVLVPTSTTPTWHVCAQDPTFLLIPPR